MTKLTILLVALALALAACGGSTAETSTTTTTAATQTTTDAPSTTATTTSTSAPGTTSGTSTTLDTTTSTTVAPSTTESPGAKVVLIAIEIADGQVVVGEEEYEVERDSIVELVVTADIGDEVHVHGYNEYIDLTPGTPGSVTFTADIPGVFEVELEGFGMLLFELVVS